MKFGFVTCVQLGLSCIERIYEIGGKLDVLITIPDHKSKFKSGRIYLDNISAKNNIPLYKVNHINDVECVEIIKKYDLDWLFIIGWSQIASSSVLKSPKKGCIGMHPTLLPEGRGRAAIPWAILKGLEKTGVTMFAMNEGVDTGEILGQIEIPLNNRITATELYEKVNEAHVNLIQDVFPNLVNNQITRIIQDESKSTYWEGRIPSDGLIDGNFDVKKADALVRATTHPYPGAYFILDGKKIIVWSAVFGDNPLEDKIFLKLVDGFLIPRDYSIQEL